MNAHTEDAVTTHVESRPLLPTWCVLALLFLAVAGTTWYAATRPVLVRDSKQWVRHAEPFQLVGRAGSDEATLFRRRVTTTGDADSLEFSIETIGSHTVFLDDHELGASDPLDAGGRSRSVLHVRGLRAGTHAIVVAVVARSTHPCLRVDDPLSRASTGKAERWESSRDGREWTPTSRLDEFVGVAGETANARVIDAFRESWPWLLALSVAGAWWGASRRVLDERSVRRVRDVSMLALAALCLNDWLRLPTGVGIGMDVDAHVAYVREVMATWRVPLADEGWERLQPPLHYFVTAAFAVPAGWLGAIDLERVSRVVPILCCLTQVHVAWRCVRLAFPAAFTSQIVALVVASFLPMSIYVSQVNGNEPLAALCVAVAIWLVLRIATRPEIAASWRAHAVLGLVLGLGALTKLTTFGIVPLAVLVSARAAYGARGSRRAIAAVGIVVSVFVLVSGWYYARNWIELGRPFVGGWDFAQLNQEWWQDPGQRIPEHFTRFGRALSQPVHASAGGLWDALYSTAWLDGASSGRLQPPPWNTSAMLVGAWIGAPVTIGVIVGAVLAVVSRRRTACDVALLAIVALLVPIVLVFAQFPAYSAAKATYMLGAAPAIGILAARGAEPLVARTAGRALVGAILVILVGAVLVAYWVASTNG